MRFARDLSRSSKSLIEWTSVYCDKLMVIQESISAQWGTGRDWGKRRQKKKNGNGGKEDGTFHVYCTRQFSLRDRQTDGRRSERPKTYEWRIERFIAARSVRGESLRASQTKEGTANLPNFSRGRSN